MEPILARPTHDTIRALVSCSPDGARLPPDATAGQPSTTPGANQASPANIPAVCISHRLPIFPCGPDKRPLTEHGFKDATTDPDTISDWERTFPGCLWGMPTGPATASVIDVDSKNGGVTTWEELRTAHPEPLGCQVAHDGAHLIFSGSDLGRHTPVRGWPGVDLLAGNGYVILYDAPDPSQWEPIPPWIVDEVSRPRRQVANTRRRVPEVEDTQRATIALGRLAAWRKEDYKPWLDVGMALRELGEDGLVLWDHWSQGSEKYQQGTCAAKWETLSPVSGGLSLASLHYWAAEDNPGDIRPCPSHSTAADYSEALGMMGFSFQYDEGSGDILANGVRQTLILRNSLAYQLHCRGYKDVRSFDLALDHLAMQQVINPLRDYFDRLSWDGKDHIGKLASYFTDAHDVFGPYLRRWLVGAVYRISYDGARNLTLVLDGRQSIGKSYFCRWLARPFPGYHYEGPIDTDDKDCYIRLVKKMVWEVAELGATQRKSDRNALKGFLSQEHVTFRKPYGHGDIEAPARASFIATVNNEVGFLDDPTGSDRYMATTLQEIRHEYAEDVDVNQVWAQAAALVRRGEGGWPTSKELSAIRSINQGYETSDPEVADVLSTYFETDPERAEWFTPTSDLVRFIRDYVSSPAGRALEMRLAAVLRRAGCRQERRRDGGNPKVGWVGIHPRKG